MTRGMGTYIAVHNDGAAFLDHLDAQVQAEDATESETTPAFGDD